MNSLVLGLICGLTFGTVDVLLMLPLDFPDKRTALAAAFASRFAIGFLIPFSRMTISPWLKGVVVSLLISLPDAIVTKAFAPILVSGFLGGAVIGWASDRWGDPSRLAATKTPG